MARRLGLLLPCVSLLIALSACASRVDIDKVPLGSAIEVTRQDGGVLRGTLANRDDQNLRLDVGRTTRSIPRSQIAGIALTDAKVPPPLPPAAKFREYQLPAGTRLAARLEMSLGSDTSHVNDPVEATLITAEVLDGIDILPVGSTLRGIVTVAERSGNVKGRASLAMHFTAVTVPGRDDAYDLSTGLQHTAAATKGDDAKKIGIPALGGAILGALIGGKKGALIGTAIGGGAGAVVVLTTSGPEVRYTRGTTLALTLDQPIDVRIAIQR